MSSIWLKDLLKHKIRKNILKNNKKINHKSFVKSMGLAEKIPFLMKYHKKKLIFFLLFGIITWTYQLQTTFYYWFKTMRPPHIFLLSFIVDMPQSQATVNQLNQILRISLSEDTKEVLIKLFYEADKYLYFGVGRKYLFHVYSELGQLQTQQEQLVFWKRSEFHKKRNQLAAGVGLVEHLQLFEQALKRKKEKDSTITEQQFKNQFVRKFIQKAPEIIQWQRQFNCERERQFLKNAPGLTEVKKQTISDLLKQNPNISINDLQIKLKQMGLKGLNLSQKYFYYRTRQVWHNMRQFNLLKALSHPTIHMNLNQKARLENEVEKNRSELEKINSSKQQNLEEYIKLYEKELI